MRRKAQLLITALLTQSTALLSGAHAQEAFCADAKCYEPFSAGGGATSFLQTSTAWGLGRSRQLTSEEDELRRLRNEVAELKEAAAATLRQLAEGAVLPADNPSLYVPATPYAPASPVSPTEGWELQSAQDETLHWLDPHTAAKLTEAFPGRASYYAAQILKNPAALAQQDEMLLENANKISGEHASTLLPQLVSRAESLPAQQDEMLVEDGNAISEKKPSSLLPQLVSREESPPARWQQEDATRVPQPALLQPVLPAAGQQAPFADLATLPQLAPLPQPSPRVQLALLQAQATPQSQLMMLQSSNSRSSSATSAAPQCGGPDLVSCSQMNSILTFGYKVKIWEGVIGWILVICAGVIAISVLSYVLYYVFQVTAWIAFIFQTLCCIAILAIIGFVAMGVKSVGQ